jgi:hypothetical protein
MIYVSTHSSAISSSEYRRIDDELSPANLGTAYGGPATFERARRWGESLPVPETWRAAPAEDTALPFGGGSIHFLGFTQAKILGGTDMGKGL